MHQVGRATYEAYMGACGLQIFPDFKLLSSTDQEAWKKAEIAGLQASMRVMSASDQKCSAEHQSDEYLTNALRTALTAMNMVDVFVTTKERIKHPEGTDLWRSYVEQVEDALLNHAQGDETEEAEPAKPEEDIGAIADEIERMADNLAATQDHSALQRAATYRRLATVLREPGISDAR